MPVQYTGLIDEHTAVREKAGLFDVSHMGIATLEGAHVHKFLNDVVTRDLSKVIPGKAAYSLLCRESGGTVDDLILYRQSETLYYAVLNASNKDKDVAYLRSLNTPEYGVQIKTHFDTHSLLALQGPKSEDILRRLGFAQAWPEAFTFLQVSLLGIPVHLAFTGYTGERGCEIFVANENALKLWNALMEQGLPLGLKPVGLGARDTLRTEMGYSLYGHELSETINPVEAGLSWAVGFKKDRFVGKAALDQAKAHPTRKLVALKNNSKQAPRPGMKVFDLESQKECGEICSGTFAPSLGYVIGLALVSAQSSGRYAVDIRGAQISFETTTRPFLKRATPL